MNLATSFDSAYLTNWSLAISDERRRSMRNKNNVEELTCVGEGRATGVEIVRNDGLVEDKISYTRQLDGQNTVQWVGNT